LGGAGGEGSIEALTEVMTANGFVLLETKELPLVLREHKRKYQWVVSFSSWFRPSVSYTVISSLGKPAFCVAKEIRRIKC